MTSTVEIVSVPSAGSPQPGHGYDTQSTIDLQASADAHDAITKRSEAYVAPAQLCVAMAGLTSLVSLLLAAKVLYWIATHNPGDEGRYFTWSIISFFYFGVLIESSACLITMCVWFSFLLHSPHCILPDASHCNKFFCLCFTIVLLFVCSIYSAAVSVLCADFDSRITPPPTSSLLSIARMIALTFLLCVLIRHYKAACVQAYRIVVE